MIIPDYSLKPITRGRLTPPKGLPSLTGLRGAAALWVILFHFSFLLRTHLHIPLDLPLLREGYLGVDVFFILSGFILCHVYVSSFKQYKVREHIHFLLIRLARIYPLHLAVMLAFVLAVWLVPAPRIRRVIPDILCTDFSWPLFCCKTGTAIRSSGMRRPGA